MASMSTPAAVVFSDPNCPFCWALEHRLDALGLLDRTAWRGVQHAPHLPVPMAAASPGLAAELGEEGRSLASIAPEVPLSAPGGKPNTALAIATGAAALATDPVAGRRFVRELYRAFWTRGADLSSAEVLAEIARGTGLPALEVGSADHDRARAWQAEWEGLGMGGVPLVVRMDGQVLYGLADVPTIRAFFAEVPV